jgi:hypothetical protein
MPEGNFVAAFASIPGLVDCILDCTPVERSTIMEVPLLARVLKHPGSLDGTWLSDRVLLSEKFPGSLAYFGV